jgi:hypothetical protein
VGVCSVRGLVDQIIIADTGSTDYMIAVARECGLPLEVTTPKPRNIALAPMTTDWVLVLDLARSFRTRRATAFRICYGAVMMPLGILSVSATTSSNASTIC